MKIAPDKWKHFWVGIPLGTVLGIGFRFLYPGQVCFPAFMALVGVTAVAYGFELFSLITGWGHHDIWDAVASVIGGIIGIGIMLMLYLL